MLNYLCVQDFVIVRRTELEFRQGLTVLTGETGAGKSMLIDALSLLTGGRSEPGLVRQGAERAELNAEFDIRAVEGIAGWLAANELADDEGRLLIRRTIDHSGRSRTYINGTSVTLAQLKEAGEFLLDIHGQHAHQSLLKGNAQREMLDGYAGLGTLAQQVRESYSDWQHVKRQVEERRRNAAAINEEIERLTWQINEVKPVLASAANWQELEEEHTRLTHAASLIEGADGAQQYLVEAEGALLPQLQGVVSRLRDLAGVDTALTEPFEMLDSAAIQIKEAANALRHYAQRIDLDPARLEEVSQQIQQVHDVSRKYRIPPEELAALCGDWESRLGELGGDADDSELARKEEELRQAAEALGRQLSDGRRQAAEVLSARITDAMQTMAMEGGRLAIGLNPLDALTAQGFEQVEFLVAGHGGMEPRPLSKVASGGELSRISLAIAVITSEIARVPVMIFDEVDVGIGGRVAEMVGQHLKALGQGRQVLCITHLPQVAAQGDTHWQVFKTQQDNSVRSDIRFLDDDARIEEISRMLGGVEITSTTRAHAQEMLGLV